MAKEKKGFFKEFKTFITRGNVIDMAVGVIIGGAFSAIVTALTNQILMPIINVILFAITGGKGLENIYTYLHKAVLVDETGQTVIDAVTQKPQIDLANSIYIDWGAFITAIINFLLIALVLFLIIKVINSVHAGAAEAKKKYEPLTKEEVKELRRAGKTRDEILAAAAEKKAKQEAEAAAAAAAAAATPPAPTTEELLIQIRDLLKAQEAAKQDKKE